MRPPPFSVVARISTLAVAFLWLAGSPQTASATLISFGFAGNVRFVERNSATPEVVVGTPVSGSYTFESTTPDSNPSASHIGDYFLAIQSVDVSVGTHRYVYAPQSVGRILITTTTSDVYRVDARGNPPSNTSEITVLFDFSASFNAGTFPDDSLPVLPPVRPNIAQFPMPGNLTVNERLSDSEVLVTSLRLDLDSFFLVPEPGSAQVLIPALLLLLGGYTGAQRRLR